MPRLATPLNDMALRRARAKDRAYRQADGNGLYLEVSPAGAKSWLVRYKLPGAGSHTAAAIGRYPAVTLADARAHAIEAQQRARLGPVTAESVTCGTLPQRLQRRSEGPRHKHRSKLIARRSGR